LERISSNSLESMRRIGVVSSRNYGGSGTAKNKVNLSVSAGYSPAHR
jgi:hypothetical protein